MRMLNSQSKVLVVWLCVIPGASVVYADAHEWKWICYYNHRLHYNLDVE